MPADPEIYFEETPMPTTSPPQLSYDVFVSEGPAGAGDERMPDGAPLAWSPLSPSRPGRRSPTFSTGTTGSAQARVFDLEQEPDFAGHPVLGAAAL